MENATIVKSEGNVSAGQGVKQKQPLETEILRDICEALSQRGVFFWRSNNMPSLGRFGVDGKARFRAMPKYAIKGVADILCVHEGKFIALEVKRPGMKLRPEQAEYGLKVIKNGGVFSKVTSVNEALEVIGL
jgi:hypothetical protein